MLQGSLRYKDDHFTVYKLQRILNLRHPQRIGYNLNMALILIRGFPSLRFKIGSE